MVIDKTQSGGASVSIGLTWSEKSNRAELVILRREDGQIRAAGTETVSSPEQWKELLVRCRPDKSSRPAVCAGLDSSQVGFYTFDLPPVESERLAPIVRTQAERCLPLPLEQMHYTWRADDQEGGKRCLLAAIRRETLEGLYAALPGAGLRAVLPDVQALVCGWYEGFQSSERPSILLCVLEREAVAILAERRNIRQVIRIDIDPHPASAALWVNDTVQAVRTLRSEAKEAPVYLWDLGSDRSRELSAALVEQGLSVTPCEPDPRKIRLLGLDNPEVLRRRPREFALALLGLDGRPTDFDFTRQETALVSTTPKTARRRIVLHAVAALLVLAAGWYWKDRMELETLERRLNEPRDGQTAAAFLERQEYRKQIARTRPDLIDLMTVLQETRPEGVLLDSLVFELGKPVEIKGQADSYEQAYEFHKNLSGKSGVSKPQLIEPAMDEKTRKVKFAIQFAYRHFSR